MNEYVIIGSGFSGSVLARLLAENNNKITILERRNHIAGNMYDEKNKDGILYHKYGPHIFHTNNEEVYNFIIKHGEWIPFIMQNKVEMFNKLVPSPFNFEAIDLMFHYSIANAIKREFKKIYENRDRVTIVEMLESNSMLIKAYADILWKEDYQPYTSKQWGLNPEEIDVSILKRVPVIIGYEDSYFNDKYQLMPKNGYTNYFENLLNHENITIKLNIDALNLLEIKNEKVIIDGFDENITVIFTGAIDELLKYKYGRLPYRSLNFEYKELNIESYQPCPVAAYPLAEGYTRVAEYKKLPPQNVPNKTIVAYEYPVEYNDETSVTNEPYYPILNPENLNNYLNYKDELTWIKNLYLCGRLADYKYYNMDNAIENAFKVFEEIIGE